MYMPLCRECHARESRFHETVFDGNPEEINVTLENETQLENKNKAKDCDRGSSGDKTNDSSVSLVDIEVSQF